DASLFPTGDSAGLAKALLGALDRSPEVVERLARGHERVSSFAMSRLAEAYIARYERLVV
ncbi:MAG: hypothetical protein AAFN30_15570, partial [Actinomycetota bacterium]